MAVKGILSPGGEKECPATLRFFPFDMLRAKGSLAPE